MCASSWRPRHRYPSGFHVIIAPYPPCKNPCFSAKNRGGTHAIIAVIIGGGVPYDTPIPLTLNTHNVIVGPPILLGPIWLGTFC